MQKRKKGGETMKDSEEQRRELTLAIKVETYCHHAVMMIKGKLTIFCHGSLVQAHPWNWWEFNGPESTLSLMHFLAHRSQLKLKSAFCKIKLTIVVCCSESSIWGGLSWVGLLKEKPQVITMELCLWEGMKLLSQHKEIYCVWVTFQEGKDCFTGSCYWLLFL